MKENQRGNKKKYELKFFEENKSQIMRKKLISILNGLKESKI
jgi:hypothetical protein